MTMLFALTILVVAVIGWMLVKRYERHLDAQIGPWIAHELKPQRSRPRLVRRRAEAGEL